MADGSGNRLRALDSLRGVAALGIVLWHYRVSFLEQPLARLLEPFYLAGYYAVDFFFVLSGFVLMRAYGGEPRRHALRENLVRRVARIYPLHLFTLLAVLGVQVAYGALSGRSSPAFAHNDVHHFVLNLLLLQFVGLQDGFSFNTPSWSISTEFYVNLVFFALLWTRWRLNAVFAAIALASLALLAFQGNGELARDDAILGVQVSVFRTAFGFFVGVLLHQAWRRRPRSLPGWASDAGFAAVAGAVLAAGTGRLGDWPGFEMGVVLLGFPLLIVLAIGGGLVQRALSWRPLAYLGDLSYSLYLIHFPTLLGLALLRRQDVLAWDFGSAWTLLAVVAGCLGLSALSYHGLELPLQQRINRRWAPRRPA